MSGHSKWNNIKRKKEKPTAKGQNLYQDGPGDRGSGQGRAAAPDPASNSKLKDAIAKAKANNVPNDNIDRIIKKAAGEGSGDKYEALQYEGTARTASPSSSKH